MEKTIILTVALLFLLSAAHSSHAQSCGEGDNQITVFVPNGQKAVNTRYQLYPASPLRYKNEDGMIRKLEFVAEYLSTTFFPLDEIYFSRWWIRPRIVRSEYAEKFVKAYDPKFYEQPFVYNDRHNKFSFSGTIDGDSFSIHTYEMDDMPFLLKVWADNYEPVYVLEAFRGGCSRKYDLLLTKYIEPKKGR